MGRVARPSSPRAPLSEPSPRCLLPDPPRGACGVKARLGGHGLRQQLLAGSVSLGCPSTRAPVPSLTNLAEPPQPPMSPARAPEPQALRTGRASRRAPRLALSQHTSIHLADFIYFFPEKQKNKCTFWVGKDPRTTWRTHESNKYVCAFKSPAEQKPALRSPAEQKPALGRLDPPQVSPRPLWQPWSLGARPAHPGLPGCAAGRAEALRGGRAPRLCQPRLPHGHRAGVGSRLGRGWSCLLPGFRARSLPTSILPPQGPRLFSTAWGRGGSVGTAGSRLSVTPSCSSLSLGRREGVPLGVRGRDWGELSAGPSGTSSGGTGTPVSPESPREPFGVWGTQQGFHIWPGRTEGAGGRDRSRRVWTAPGSGPTCCRPRLGQGRAAVSRVPCGGWPRAGTPSPTWAALARACRPGQGDAVRAAGQRPAQWEGRGAQSLPSAVALWGFGFWGAVGVLDGCESPHCVQGGWGRPGCGGEALAVARLALWPGLGRPAHLLLRAPSEVHPLLVHPLGLHPLDEAEEILVGHGGAAGHPVGRRAALVVDPGGLGRHGQPVGGLAFPPRGSRGQRPCGRARGRGGRPAVVPAQECGPGRLGPPGVRGAAALGAALGARPESSPPRRAGSRWAQGEPGRGPELRARPPRPAQVPRRRCGHEPLGWAGAAAPVV